MEAYQTLAQNGVGVRVVSMPCAEIFVEQDASYRDRIAWQYPCSRRS
jgi:transketolase